MNCTQCNAPVPENSLFCPECGAKVEAPAPVSATFCENCGAALAAGAAFCENCGSKIGAQPVATAPEVAVTETPAVQEPAAPAAGLFCPECGAAMESGSLFCEHCGAKVQEPEQPAKPPRAPMGNPLKKLNIPPKYLKLGLIGLAAVVVVIVAVCLIVNLTAKNDYALYIKDGELVYSQLPEGDAPLDLTSKLSATDSYSLYRIRSLMALSEDGKTLFFPDKMNSSYDGSFGDYSLYYQDITNPKSEAERIASGVTSHVVNQKGTLVTYLKEGTLYQSDLKEDSKIASNVRTFYVSKDGSMILYLTNSDMESGGSLYIVKNGDDSDKISSGVSTVHYVSDDFNTFLYQKENAIYRANNNGDHEKLLNNAGNWQKVYSPDSIYYTVEEEKEISYWDLIKDDVKEETYKSQEVAVVREHLKTLKRNYQVTKLYYFNGNDSVVVSENYDSLHSVDYNNPQFLYTENPTELPKVKLSKVMDMYSDYYYYYYEDIINELVEEAAQDMEPVLRIAIKGSAYTLEAQNVANIRFSDDGKTAYVFADYDNEGNYATRSSNVYKLSLSDGGLGELTLMDEEVYHTYSRVSGGRLIYYKDVDDMVGELHIDGKMVENNVYMGSILYCSETDSYGFLADYDINKQEGTLMEYKDGKRTEVKEEVFGFAYSPCGNLLFLHDYNKNRGEGDLWIWEGGKCRQLDEEVNAILQFP